ncbi:hypothetical protein MCGFDL_MCGFDL_11790, partial [Dysosmobacter welbionis]
FISQEAAGSAATCLSSSRRMPAFRASSSVMTAGASWAVSSPFFRVDFLADLAAGSLSAAFSAASAAARSA